MQLCIEANDYSNKLHGEDEDNAGPAKEWILFKWGRGSVEVEAAKTLGCYPTINKYNITLHAIKFSSIERLYSLRN